MDQDAIAATATLAEQHLAEATLLLAKLRLAGCYTHITIAHPGEDGGDEVCTGMPLSDGAAIRVQIRRTEEY